MSTSTLPPVAEGWRVRRARDRRRAGLVLLAAFVLAGATGLLGTRTSETTVRDEGYELTVTYPRVSRPGHAVKVQMQLSKEGGFGDSPIPLRYSSNYFDLFDENAFTPHPDSETADTAFTIAEFAPPPGDVFVISVDTRVEPARQRGTDGEVSLLDESGSPVLTATFSTWLWP